MENNEYKYLLDLKKRIEKNQATDEEKKQYVEILYNNGSITKEQYNNFLQNKNTDDIIKAGLVIGGVLLATWLLSKLLGD